MEKPDLVTTKEAAELLSVSPQTLCNWRTRAKRGEGEEPIKSICLGRKAVRYERKDVMAFLEQQRGKAYDH